MKQRLTITLADDVLNRVDQLIDGKKIRNRSHAIEHLVTKSLQPQVETAVILAGGAKDEGRETIRPLTLINDKPLIQHTFEHFLKFGIKKVIIATNQRGKAIQEMFGDGQQLGLEITYSYEETPLGTAGALKKAAINLEGQPFLVWAGDILTDINLLDLSSFHRNQEAAVTIAVKPRQTHQSYDNVFMQGHTIVDFKPSLENQQVSLVNAGVYIFDPAALEMIPDTTPSMLESDVFPKLTKLHSCVAFVFQGFWFDIESDQNYQQVLNTTLACQE